MYITITPQNIDYETGKALLIKFPRKSDMAGSKFWMPKALITRTRNYYIDIFIPEDFIFTIVFKNGDKERLELDDIKDDLIALNYREIMYRKEIEETDKESYLQVEEPVKIDVDSVGVDESLKR